MEATSSVRMSLRAPSRRQQQEPLQQQERKDLRLPAEVNWEMLDKTRFFLFGAAMFSGVSGMLYPSLVLKTRQQVCSSGASSSSNSSLSMMSAIVRSQGVGGLYRGFSTSLLGTIPARALYMTTLEVTKSAAASAAEQAGFSAAAGTAISNAVGGMSAAVAAQLVWTPVDVISQRLMVQGPTSARGTTWPPGPGATSGPASAWRAASAGGAAAATYAGGVDALRKILAVDGPRGLYRGFGMSIITYAPSNAVWWACYCLTQRAVWSLAGCSAQSEMGAEAESELVVPEVSPAAVMAAQAGSAAVAGGVAAAVTAPLDTVKTRLQVGRAAAGVDSFGSVLRGLLAEGGWRACYKGLGPRWASMSISATAMITTYELLKRLSAKAAPPLD